MKKSLHIGNFLCPRILNSLSWRSILRNSWQYVRLHWAARLCGCCFAHRQYLLRCWHGSDFTPRETSVYSIKDGHETLISKADSHPCNPIVWAELQVGWLRLSQLMWCILRLLCIDEPTLAVENVSPSNFNEKNASKAILPISSSCLWMSSTLQSLFSWACQYLWQHQCLIVV